MLQHAQLPQAAVSVFLWNVLLFAFLELSFLCTLIHFILSIEKQKHQSNKSCHRLSTTKLLTCDVEMKTLLNWAWGCIVCLILAGQRCESCLDSLPRWLETFFLGWMRQSEVRTSVRNGGDYNGVLIINSCPMATVWWCNTSNSETQ